MYLFFFDTFFQSSLIEMYKLNKSNHSYATSKSLWLKTILLQINILFVNYGNLTCLYKKKYIFVYTS